MSRSVIGSLFLLLLLSCKPGPPPKQTSTPLLHPTVLTFDTLSLGDPVSAFIDRFGDPCDDDPIDRERATLYFWAGGDGCKEQKPFPEDTTVIAVTPYSKAAKEQPVELLVWFGGAYFNNRSSMKIRIGDRVSAVNNALGEPVHQNAIEDLADIKDAKRVDYNNDIHVLFRGDEVVGIAVGRMRGGEEREALLARGYAHHLKYLSAREGY